MRDLRHGTAFDRQPRVGGELDPAAGLPAVRERTRRHRHDVHAISIAVVRTNKSNLEIISRHFQTKKPDTPSDRNHRNFCLTGARILRYRAVVMEFGLSHRSEYSRLKTVKNWARKL